MCGISRSRQRGAQLVITVHNAQPHESDKRWLRRHLARYLSSRVAGYVHLSYASVGMLGHAGYRVLVAPHGVYPPVDRPSSLSVAFEPFEPRLKSSHNAVLWFGRIRSYKGIEDLVSIRGEQSGWDLWITGYPDDQDLAERLAFAARYDPGIHLRLSHVPEEDLDTIIRSSRLVCLPYNRVLNSGAAMRALSLHVPVLLPWSETFEELRRDVGEGWVNLYRGRLHQEAVTHALAAKRDHSPDLARYEWRQIADSHLAFYQELLSGDARQ
jgi:beta-1,4-mannosyltransferase